VQLLSLLPLIASYPLAQPTRADDLRAPFSPSLVSESVLPESVLSQLVSSKIVSSELVSSESGRSATRRPLDQGVELFVDTLGQCHQVLGDKLVVLAFLSPSDAVSFAYMPTLEAMSMKTRSIGGEFFGVVSAAGFSPAVVERFRRECKGNFPILLDENKHLESLFAAQLRAQKTGKVIVWQQNKCVFAGSIDHRFDAISERQDLPTLEEELDMIARQMHLVPHVMLVKRCSKPSW
jgi:hypothetical protein